jgi:general secretion pathway protein B
VSFILDALRKSEHERQRSALPGLSQVPQAAPVAHLPRWALVVIGALAVAVLALGGAWWQSTRPPAETEARSAPTVQRNVELPLAPTPPAVEPRPPAPARTAPSTLSQPSQTALAAAATPSPEASPEASEPAFTAAERPQPTTADTATLPSAAALAAQGVSLPPLRLELHAFSEQPRDRFVFINGRKYVEGERLIEGPQVVSIEPRGAVLSQAGQRFRLVPE